MAKIAIAWSGLPIYAAKSISYTKELLSEDMVIISSQPDVPIKGVEEELVQPVLWIDIREKCSWVQLNQPVPELFFMTGWRNHAFNCLAKEVKDNGGKLISLIDNCWKNTLRQWVGAIIFRVRYRPLFDYVWVPGKSATYLCRFLGMSKDSIFQGLYCADSRVFSPNSSLSSRDKEFIFVGRFIHRKGIDILIESFERFHLEFPDWTLTLVGSGSKIPDSNNKSIKVVDFLPSELIAGLMQKSRFLILPSREEHWGVVVHEATLSGCGLVLSDCVGALPDLLDGNGFSFKSGSSDDLFKAMIKAASLNDKELQIMGNKSIQNSHKFSVENWAKTFVEIMNIANTSAG